MILSSYDQKAHDHEEKDNEQEDRHGHASATAADSLLGSFCESPISFSATGEQQADDAARKGANQDKS